MPRPSLLLIHGPATAAWLWKIWRSYLTPLGWEVNVLDLKGHGRSLPTDLGLVTMDDYLADVESVAGLIEQTSGTHPIVGGWDMGALLAMMYAAPRPRTPGLLLFSPSLPLEVGGKASIEQQRRHPQQVLDHTAFGVYTGAPARTRESLFDLSDDDLAVFLRNSEGALESGLAYRQRLRGISVASHSVSPPSLIVHGSLATEPSPAQCRSLAEHLGGQSLGVAGASHWGVVFSETMVAQAAPAVAAWLDEHFPDDGEPDSR